MQYRVLRNLGSGWPSYVEGQIVELDRDIAVKLLKANLVVEEPDLAAPVDPASAVAPSAAGADPSKRRRKRQPKRQE